MRRLPPARRTRRAITCAAALALAACASSGPPPGSGAPRRSVLETTYDDARAGREAEQDVIAQIGVIEDTALEDYVNAIGHKLLRGIPRRGFDYRFKIVDMTEPNAFALPGGAIFISRGLLALANDEDELACVMGHEITHAARRHAAAQQALAQRINPLAMPWNRAAQMAAYGRGMEREADEVGQILCAAAGYDPMGLSTFLRSLEQLERLRLGHSRQPSFLDTHPGSQERATANAVRAGEIRWRRDPELGDTHQALLAKTEGLAVGDRPEAGVFLGDTFVHPILNFQIRFPSGWQQMNSNQAVGAVAPRGDAVVFLVAEEAHATPREAAERWLAKARETQQITLSETGPVKVGSLDAWRMRLSSNAGGLSVTSYVTFVPYDAATWRITGMAQAAAAGRYLGRTLLASRSFGPARAEQLAKVRVRRLATVRARPGEDLEKLGRRTGNAWDVTTTAVYNGLFSSHRFEGGERVKIVREEAFVRGE